MMSSGSALLLLPRWPTIPSDCPDGYYGVTEPPAAATNRERGAPERSLAATDNREFLTWAMERQ